MEYQGWARLQGSRVAEGCSPLSVLVPGLPLRCAGCTPPSVSPPPLRTQSPRSSRQCYPGPAAHGGWHLAKTSPWRPLTSALLPFVLSSSCHTSQPLFPRQLLPPPFPPLRAQASEFLALSSGAAAPGAPSAACLCWLEDARQAQGYVVKSALARSTERMRGRGRAARVCWVRWEAARLPAGSPQLSRPTSFCLVPPHPAPVHKVHPGDAHASKPALRAEELKADISKRASNLVRI